LIQSSKATDTQTKNEAVPTKNEAAQTKNETTSTKNETTLTTNETFMPWLHFSKNSEPQEPKAISSTTISSMPVESHVIAQKTKPLCVLTTYKIPLDYKNVALLSRFVSENGRILPRHLTHLKLKKQKELAKTIRRSRTAGLLPFVSKLPEYSRHKLTNS
jgi:small subunit ribosomal protein S18